MTNTKVSEMKAAVILPDAVKEEVKATGLKAEETPKKTEVKKPAAPKKPIAKKTTAKKQEPKVSVVVEYMGKSMLAKDMIAKAKKHFTKVNKGVEIKTIEIYVKPEEAVAYYVVNGIGSDDYKVVL